MDTRGLHRILLLVSFLIFSLVLSFFLGRERTSFLGIPVMSERAYAALPEYAYVDLGEYLSQNGQPAPLDREESALYISIDLDSYENAWSLPATLELHHLDYRLSFAPDPAFDDFRQAVSQGHRFSLLAVGNGHHMKYDVVFTTLPVIRITTNDQPVEFGVHKGNLCLWDAGQSKDGYYSVMTSSAQWHRRGGTSKMYEKPSYKISLKNNAFSRNNSLSLLGLGSDDDWILNSMVMDDLKVREKTITTLWNALQETTSYQIRMSDCRYVEAIIDGRYMGLYMLQRRVDNKYLGEGHEEDIILKGELNEMSHLILEEAFIVKENPNQIELEEIYRQMAPFYDLMTNGPGTDGSLTIDDDNWIDYNVFTSFFSLPDNAGYKNIIYILNPQPDGYRLQFDFWDTDMAFGYRWDGTKIDYLPQIAMTGEVDFRIEAKVRFRRDPMLYQRLAARYAELRKTLLSLANVEKTILDCYQEITESQSYERDQARWGFIYQGEDTLEALLEFIRVRSVWLDEEIRSE